MKKLLIILFFPLSLFGQTTFYVAPDGNDSNAGTITEPWRTWGKAFNDANIDPGDTVYFRDGVYYKKLTDGEDGWYYPNRSSNGTGYEVNRRGVSGNRVHYFAYPGETPILDSDSMTSPNYLHYGIRSNVSYCHFKGLHIRNVEQIDTSVYDCIGVLAGGTDYIFENCSF